MARETKTHLNQDIILEELRIIQEEMKANNILLAKLSTTVESIDVQTTKTNGRVNRLEERVNIHRGGIYVAYVIMAIIVLPLIIAWIK